MLFHTAPLISPFLLATILKPIFQKLDTCHLPLSVAVASNIPGYESGVCFVTEGDEELSVQKLVNYLETLSDICYQLLVQKFDYVFEQLENNENARKEKILNEFHCYCKELVVLSFNSASYDLNLIKPTLIRILLKDIQFVIKRTNNYLCLKTSKLRFLDIKNFWLLVSVTANFW